MKINKNKEVQKIIMLESVKKKTKNMGFSFPDKGF